MSIQLPAPLARYFDAENAHDADAVALLFNADATVHDDGEVHRGRDAIRDWNRASGAHYAATVTPLACTATPRGSEVRCTVAGNFPGSPLPLTFAFDLDGGAISKLEVAP